MAKKTLKQKIFGGTEGLETPVDAPAEIPVEVPAADPVVEETPAEAEPLESEPEVEAEEVAPAEIEDAVITPLRVGGVAMSQDGGVMRETPYRLQ